MRISPKPGRWLVAPMIALAATTPMLAACAEEKPKVTQTTDADDAGGTESISAPTDDPTPTAPATTVQGTTALGSYDALVKTVQSQGRAPVAAMLKGTPTLEALQTACKAALTRENTFLDGMGNVTWPAAAQDDIDAVMASGEDWVDYFGECTDAKSVGAVKAKAVPDDAAVIAQARKKLTSAK